MATSRRGLPTITLQDPLPQGEVRGRIRKITAVALARKLLIALWRYVTTGLVPEGARLKAG